MLKTVWWWWQLISWKNQDLGGEYFSKEHMKSEKNFLIIKVKKDREYKNSKQETPFSKKLENLDNNIWLSWILDGNEFFENFFLTKFLPKSYSKDFFLANQNSQIKALLQKSLSNSAWLVSELEKKNAVFPVRSSFFF